MQNEIAAKIKRLDLKKRNIIIAAAVLITFVLIFLITQFFSGPQRSISAYCQIYKEEKARLAKLPGDTWPTGVFNDEVGNASEIAKSLGRLESVAPDNIHDDTKTLVEIYQKIYNEPSQAISASLSGVSAEDNVKNWTGRHCGGTGIESHKEG